MGFLDFFLGKKEQQLRFAEIGRLCADRKAQLKARAHEDLARLLEKIDSKIAEAKDHLSSLSSAELFNKKISDREVQIMEGNRQTYILKTNLFLTRLSSSKPADIEAVQPYLELFAGEFEALAKGSARSYYMLSEFFHNEAAKVASCVKDIERLFGQLGQLNENYTSESRPLAEIAELMDLLKNSVARLKELKAEKKQEDVGLESLQAEEKRLEKEAKALMATAPHHELDRLKAELAAVTLELKKQGDALAADFTALDKALRKFAKKSNDELFIEDYLRDPASALISDTEGYIVPVLSRVKAGIENGSLELKDRMQEKALAKLGSMTEEYLSDFADSYKGLLSRRNLLREQIEEHPISRESLELAAKREAVRRDIASAAAKSDLLAKELAKIEPEKLKSKIKAAAEAGLGIKIAG
jgi:hypothetical protein